MDRSTECHILERLEFFLPGKQFPKSIAAETFLCSLYTEKDCLVTWLWLVAKNTEDIAFAARTLSLCY